MGRTALSITSTFHQEQEYLKLYRRALRHADQLAFDELMIHVSKHIAEAGYSNYPIPMEVFLLSMLLEEHKELGRVKAKLEQLNESK